MKYAWMGLLLLLAAGQAQSAETALERAQRAAKPPVREITPPRPEPHLTSSARKAEITRRMFWLALSLR